MHICFDWDGTLAKPDVAKEASKRRDQNLGAILSDEELKSMMKNDAHFDIYRAAIQKYTGITDRSVLTSVMTNFFQFHYLGVVNEWREKIFYPGISELLKQLHNAGHKLTIATTLRQDIVEPSLETVKARQFFRSIQGNTSDLAYEKEYLIARAIEDCGEAHYMIGDKEDDLIAGRKHKAKTIFVTWGAGELTDKSLADHVVNSPKELLKILNQN